MRNKKICEFDKLKGITIPVDLDFSESENSKILNLKIKYIGVIGNMQDYASSFEGWALIGKAKGYESIYLDIDEKVNEEKIKTNNKIGHYNRFLYRVYCFKKIFNWFYISDKLDKIVNNFYLKYLNNIELVHNVPNSEKAEKIKNSIIKNSEDDFENFFVNNKHITNRLLGLNADEYFSQLPVGLFLNKKPYGKNSIFTGKHSAIDFWTVTLETLNIIELKMGNNKKIGVLSELFFYTCYVRDIFINKIAKPFNESNFRGFNKIKNIKKIKAFILLEQKHPLLDLAYEELRKANLSDTNIEFANHVIVYKSSDYNLENVITYESVEERLKNKPIEDWSKQDVFDRYIAYGDDKELNNSDIQKLLIKHGYIDELTSLVKSVITDKEVIEKILSSNFVKKEKIILKNGKIKKIYFEENKKLVEGSNWMYIEFIDENNTVITVKDIYFKEEPKAWKNELDRYTELNRYKDKDITIIIDNKNNERKLVCALKKYE